jgi:hypothetical protein
MLLSMIKHVLKQFFFKAIPNIVQLLYAENK